MRPTIQKGQFLVRKPEYDGWGIGQFLRVGEAYSESMPDLFYCKTYGMQESGGAWAWGRSEEFACQIGIAGLETYYRPVTEAEAAAIAEDELRQQQAAWNASYPKYAHGIVIHEFGKLRPEHFTPAYLTTACGRGKI
jgi:hypothetical protein